MPESLIQGYSPRETLPNVRWCCDNLPGFADHHFWAKSTYVDGNAHWATLTARFLWLNREARITIQTKHTFEEWVMGETRDVLMLALNRLYVEQPICQEETVSKEGTLLEIGLRDKIVAIQNQRGEAAAKLFYPKHTLCFLESAKEGFVNGQVLYPGETYRSGNGCSRSLDYIDIEKSKRWMSVSCVQGGGTFDELHARKDAAVQAAVDDLMRLKVLFTPKKSN